MMVEALPEFVKAALLASFAEIGDKTFFVAMLLSAWAAQCTRARVLVFIGCVLALALHAGGTAFAHRMDVVVTHHATLHLFAATLFLGLGIKALLDLARADSDVLQKRQRERSAMLAGKFEGNSYADYLMNQNKYLNPSAPSDAQDSTNPFADDVEGSRYGSIQQIPQAPPSVAEPQYAPMDPQEDNLQALLAVFFSAFVLDLVSEFGDKSAFQLNSSQMRGHNLFFGAVFGFCLVTAFSCTVGMVIRWHVSERRLLFGAVLASFALSMASLSDGLMCFGESHKWTALLPYRSITNMQGNLQSLLQVEG
jgi:putative Ca2+/H+ antiporter (TMEM165/GDT1 family)